MVKYEVLIAEAAKGNLKEIFYWFKENISSTVADKVRDGLLDSLDSLKYQPKRFALIKTKNNKNIEYRFLLKWSFKIIFTVDQSNKTVKNR